MGFSLNGFPRELPRQFLIPLSCLHGHAWSLLLLLRLSVFCVLSIFSMARSDMPFVVVPPTVRPTVKPASLHVAEYPIARPQLVVVVVFFREQTLVYLGGFLVT